MTPTSPQKISSWKDDVHSDIRPIVRSGLFIIGGFVLLFGGWSAFFPLSAAVVATGKVVPLGQTQVIQHQSGGTIITIHAVDGQKLAKNDPIFTLDPVVNQAELSKLQDRQALFRATEARLKAQLHNEDSIDFPTEFLKPQSMLFRGSVTTEQTSLLLREDLIRGQQREFRAAKENLRQQIKGFQEQINALQKTRKGMVMSRKSLKTRANILQDKLNRMRPLAKKGYVAKNQVNDIDFRLNEVYGQAAGMTAEINATENKISGIRSQIAQTKAAARQRNSEAIVQTKAEIITLSSQIKGAQNIVAKTQIRAPVDGILTKSAIHTIGGVVKPGDIVAEIIPSQGQMIEARILVQDIDYVQKGQQAEIMITAFNQRLYDPLKATVNYVAANSQIDQNTGESFFIARLTLQSGAKSHSRINDLRAGMQAQVYIKTQDRVFLSYLLKPLTDSFRRAFREQ